VKEVYLARVRAHRIADEIVKGKYWQNGKGCAVGCTIHSSDHGKYEVELGIPEWLARVEDIIFEGLPNKRAMLWPEEFLEAIKPGVDLDKIKTPLTIFILEDAIESMNACVFDADKFPDVKAALEQSKAAVTKVIRCYREGSDLSAAYSAARSVAESAYSADSAADSAYSAARSAADSAYSAALSAALSAYSAALSAAESAADSAYSAALSAALSADSAAYSAALSAAESARSARSAAYAKFADKLLELLKGCER
jgi:hypothetical protein